MSENPKLTTEPTSKPVTVTAGIREQHLALLTTAVTWCGAVMLVSLPISALFAGVEGVNGILAASLVVGVVLGLTGAAMLVSARASAVATFGIAVMTYVTALMAVVVVLDVYASSVPISMTTFAVGSVLLTGAWLGGMMYAHHRWVRQASPIDFPPSLMAPLPGDGSNQSAASPEPSPDESPGLPSDSA